MDKRILLTSCLIFSSNGFSSDWTYCKFPENQAYDNPELSIRNSGKDWICELTPDVSGARCPGAQQRTCEGGTMPGPHDVPNGGIAWFFGTAASDNLAVRCTCGCFAPETLIASENGELPISQILEAAKFQNVSVKVRESFEANHLFRDSAGMSAKSFRVGPENKKLVVIKMSNGRTLRLTSNHPVIVNRNDGQMMITAAALKDDDILMDGIGKSVYIENIYREKMPENSKKVINFTTPEDNPASHVVLAEGVQVGDNRWQMYLEIQSERLRIRKLKLAVPLHSPQAGG